MVGLLDLPAELLEQIILHQDSVEDMISLASSSLQLHQVLSKPRMWRKLIVKANMVTIVKTKKNGAPVVKSSVNYSLFQMLMAFLKTTDDPEELLGLLQDHICLLHPGSPQDNNVTISLPLLTGPHCVSVLGLVLLALTDRQGQGPTIFTAMVEGPTGLEEVGKDRREGIRSVWEKAKVRRLSRDIEGRWTSRGGEQIEYVAMSWGQNVRRNICLLIPEILLLLLIFLIFVGLMISLFQIFFLLRQPPTSNFMCSSVIVSSVYTLLGYALYVMNDSEFFVNVYTRFKFVCICPVRHI